MLFFMAGNTFGETFRVTTFGESHGNALGAIIDGVPAGLSIDTDKIQSALDRRKPGAAQIGADGKPLFNAAVTARKEADKAEFLSGIFEGKTTGTPIAVLIRNTSQRSGDYGNLATTFRPGHADFTYFEKYGVRDYRGGGRASGRETAARVAAGEIARQILCAIFGDVKIRAYTKRAAGIECEKIDFDAIEKNTMRAADLEAAEKMKAKVETLRAQGNSAGGIVECVVSGIGAGLGEPVFSKLDAEIAKAILSVGAVKGIEFGAGFGVADMTGSDDNDEMRLDESGKVKFLTNNAGGILGGISNGNDIIFRAAIKAVPSIFQKQRTVRTTESAFEETDLEIEGRHDVCLCPRIVPVIEAMTAITLADMALRNRCAKIKQF